MADGDGMLKDALDVTRNLHRLIIATSLVTVVFSLSLRFPDKTRVQRETINEFLHANIGQYDRFITAQAADASNRWLKTVAEEIRRGLEATNYLVYGVGDIADAFEKPILLGQFKVSETRLDTPGDLTLKQLDVFSDNYQLADDVRVVVPETTNVLAQIHEFLATRAKTRARVQTVNLQTSDTYLATEAPVGGERIKMRLSFELMPNGGPPSPWFQEVFDATVKRIPDTSFRHWLRQRPEFAGIAVVDTNGLKWLPKLEELPNEIRDRRLGDVFGSLNDELKKGSPENKSVSLLGTEIPGLLQEYAAPLILLSLSYYFLFHLTHLCRFASRHKSDCEQFAWLPLSLEMGWVWEALFSLGVLPLLSLIVLNAQLWRFHFLEWGPGVLTLGAALCVGGLNWRSIRLIGKLRGQIGKPAQIRLWWKSRD